MKHFYIFGSISKKKQNMTSALNFSFFVSKTLEKADTGFLGLGLQICDLQILGSF
jgi:hypothetical protein